MRKFLNLRVYDPGQGFQNQSKMVYLKGVEQFDDSILFRFERHLEDYDNLKYMWSTGIKDKDGKEIYEGDIIKNTQGYLEKVIFNNGSFQAASINFPNANLYLLSSYNDYVEVIGNIYENIELLIQD